MFPWKTDAPIYHLPFATVGLILLNMIAFVAEMRAESIEQIEPWVLSFGDGLHPLQWVSNLFLHADPMHLLGNMIFLWAFGLVIEGKIGWWRFLLVYLAMGIFESAVSQIAMLGGEGAALGASGAIYGLVAMALVWAPSNSMSVFMLLGFRPFFFDFPILGLATLFIGLEVYSAVVGEFQMSSAMLHLAGVVPGFAIAIAMLKLDWVDCENWDVFAVLGGRQGEASEKKKKPKKPTKAQVAERQESAQAKRNAALAHFLGHLRDGNGAEALQLHDTMRRKDETWELTQSHRLALIKALHNQKAWTPSVGVMHEFLQNADDAAPRVRLRLAQILIVNEEQPSRALKVLAGIPAGSLAPDLEKNRQQLERHARKMQEEGVLEVEED
jgi:membrane associated rhomboid family serine protease